MQLQCTDREGKGTARRRRRRGIIARLLFVTPPPSCLSICPTPTVAQCTALVYNLRGIHKVRTQRRVVIGKADEVRDVA